MNRQAAITFVRSTGDVTELARLCYLLDGEPPAPAIRRQLLAGQRVDGGWSPFLGLRLQFARCYLLPFRASRAAGPHGI